MILTSNYKNKEWVLNSLFMMYYLAKLPTASIEHTFNYFFQYLLG